METKVINDVEYNIYTMQDWENDGTLKVKQGEVIEPAVFYQLRDGVPPQTLSYGIFQAGEAYAHDWDTGEPLYSTFAHVGQNYYKFKGIKKAHNLG